MRANADTAEDADRARRMGAEGIGLCRTEHMFLGERRALIERVILADNADEREAALAELVPPQTQDFVELLTAMDGLPTTIRLLDPPLHEFLPDRAELMVKVAVARSAARWTRDDVRLLAAVERLHESNPMLGLRGVRLGLTVPGLFALQVRAIAEAAAQRVKAGGDPRPEIMVPLVGSVMELHLIRDEADAILAEVARGRGRRPAHPHRHDDRAAPRRAHRLPGGRGGRVLLVRHQRPHPDHLGLLPRRRRGGVLRGLPRQGRLHGLARSRASTSTASAGWWRSRPGRDARPGPT